MYFSSGSVGGVWCKVCGGFCLTTKAQAGPGKHDCEVTALGSIKKFLKFHRGAFSCHGLLQSGRRRQDYTWLRFLCGPATWREIGPNSPNQRGTGEVFMLNSKPPKPPSWRDFVPNPKQHSRANGNKHIDFTDLSMVSKPSHDCSEPTGIRINAPAAKPCRRVKGKPKLRRTRSTFSIEHADLPEGNNMTVALADTKPKEFGLRKKTTFDARIYLDENTRRCQSWLDGVRASEPLDDVALAQGSGVDVEIAEETCSDLKPPHNSSASSSDLDEAGYLNGRIMNSHRSSGVRGASTSNNSSGVGYHGNKDSSSKENRCCAEAETEMRNSPTSGTQGLADSNDSLYTHYIPGYIAEHNFDLDKT